MQSSAGIINGCAFYRQVMQDLNKGQIPFLVGGAQILERYTGISRDVKDVDLYLRPRQVQSALEVLSIAGDRTEICYPHWLAKAYERALFVDVTCGWGNGIVAINDARFAERGDGQCR